MLFTEHSKHARSGRLKPISVERVALGSEFGPSRAHHDECPDGVVKEDTRCYQQHQAANDTVRERLNSSKKVVHGAEGEGKSRGEI